MIRFDHVTFAYPHGPDRAALRDVSLTIEGGEELAVMGGNGSGKTTLGLLLCGILTPQSGRIEIDGRPPGGSDNGPVIGFLFQDPDNGLVATTVEREVAFSLENRNLPSDQIRPVVERTLDLFNIEKYRERLVWELSGGEKQRLSLAGLFAAGPNILFLDEPASYLDYIGSRRLEQALKTVKEADPSIAIIRVTQFPAVAQAHSRVVVFGQGEILTDDRPDKVFSDRALLKKAGLRPPLEYLTPKTSGAMPVIEAPPEAIAGTVAAIENIAFNYNSKKTPHLIDGLSLDIRTGEVMALVGPSGCGKSTLAQIICGIFQPEQGRIIFADSDSRSVMSFQQPEKQFFLDTAFDEIAFGIRGDYNNPEALSEAVRESMEAAGLDFETFKDRDPHSLSGGEARRLGFAVVVALKADLIIFDEPTCALDEPGIRSFTALVAELKRRGKTVMIISHNSDIIGELADRVALLSGGRITCLTDPMSFFGGEAHKEILSLPEVMHYQDKHLGGAKTVRPGDIFDPDEI